MENNFIPVGENAGTINWDPTAGMVRRNRRNVLSPALILAHELGHAAQWISGDMDTWISTRCPREMQRLENANMRDWERPIARELGESIRRHNRDVPDDSAEWFVRVSCSTEWGRMGRVFSHYARRPDLLLTFFGWLLNDYRRVNRRGFISLHRFCEDSE